MRDKAFNALVVLGVKSESIKYYIESGWIDPNNYESFQSGFIRIHEQGASIKGLWCFDFYAGSGCKVGCPTSTKCITVWQTIILQDNSRTYPILEKFKWDDLIKAVYNNMFTKKCEQLVLF